MFLSFFSSRGDEIDHVLCFFLDVPWSFFVSRVLKYL